MYLTSAADIPRAVRAGKVRGNLGQEYQLERFVHNLTQRHPSWTSETPACKWYGVSCRDQEVFSIDWEKEKLRGSFEFSGLPPSTARFLCSKNRVFGFLPLLEFPSSLLRVVVAANQFSGLLNLNDLWSTVIYFEAHVNVLSGALDFSTLPLDLRELRLAKNNFDGELHLVTGRVLQNLQVLDLSYNSFNGALRLNGLWAPALQLSLQGNHFIAAQELRNVSLSRLKVSNSLRNLVRYSSMHVEYE